MVEFSSDQKIIEAEGSIALPIHKGEGIKMWGKSKLGKYMKSKCLYFLFSGNPVVGKSSGKILMTRWLIFNS